MTGAIFALTIAILVGVSALATEAALWYLGQEQAYGVADAAALAGARQYANDISAGETAAFASTDAQAAATTLAGINGFGSAQANNRGAIAGASSSSVQVVNLADSIYGPSTTQVTITVNFPTYLSSVFHPEAVNVGVQAVATVAQQHGACLLSLSGDLTINMGVQARNCYLASNATDSSAVSVADGVSFATLGITTTGGCNGSACTGPMAGNSGGVSRPAAAYQLATLNPLPTTTAFASLASASNIICPSKSSPFFQWADPNVSVDLTTGCPNTSAPAPVTIGTASSTTMPPSYRDASIYQGTSATDPAFQSACGTDVQSPVCVYYNMAITLGPSVVLQPGTYLLVNSTLTIPAGTTVTCSAIVSGNEDCGVTNRIITANKLVGVTIVLVGSASSAGGTLTIDPGATVTLSAPGTASYPTGSSLLNGVLFYRDPSLPADTGQTSSVQIGGNSASLLQGLMYFPTANVSFAGNIGATQPNCAIVIANALTIGSTATAGSQVHLNNSCAGYNLLPSLTPPQLPTLQAAHIVQ